jgi:SRSO17 transposase
METTEGRPMSLMTPQVMARLGKTLAAFLLLFKDCFARQAGYSLAMTYVRGLLSQVSRKNVEAIAMDQGVAPRTLQRLLESIKWDHDQLLDRVQQRIATEHAHLEAIGCVDETGTTKSGSQTVGVKRQYNGNRGKIENCVNHVALSYSAPGFNVLLDARLYLPQDWADDPVRRKKTTFPVISSFARSLSWQWN